MNDLEQRLRKLKPKINRDLRKEIAVGRRRTAGWSKQLLACACSFLLGLAVMYSVMKLPASPEPLQAQPQSQPQPVEVQEKPSPFIDESIAAKPKEPPASASKPMPKTLAGNDYTYLSLLRKYQMP